MQVARLALMLRVRNDPSGRDRAAPDSAHDGARVRGFRVSSPRAYDSCIVRELHPHMEDPADRA